MTKTLQCEREHLMVQGNHHRECLLATNDLCGRDQLIKSLGIPEGKHT